LRANPFQVGEVDVEQVIEGNFLNHIKVIMQIGPIVTIAQVLQGLGALEKTNFKFRNDGREN